MKRLPIVLLLLVFVTMILSVLHQDRSQLSPLGSSAFRLPVPSGDSPASQRFAEWANDPTQASKKVGLALAQERRTEMLALMRQDPQRALDQSLRWHQWLALPTDVQQIVEQPFSARGEYAVYSGCGELGPKHLTWLTLDDDQHTKVHLTEAWKEVPSKENLPVQGIRIGDEVALWPGVMQRLDSVDRVALDGRFPERKLDVQEGAAALVGGELVAMGTSTQAEKLESELQQALAMLGPDTAEAGLAIAYSSGGANGQGVVGSVSETSLAWSANPKRVIILRLDFSNLTGAPQSQAELEGLLTESSNWLKDSSYGETHLSTQTVTPEVIRLPKTTTQYLAIKDAGGSWSKTLATDARAAATTAGYVMTNYDIVVYSFKKSGSIGGGFANVGTRDHWASDTDVKTYVHEFGHNYGLSHANFWVRNQAGGDWREILGVQTSFGAAGNDEYGDAFDMMAVHTRSRPGSNPVWPNGDFAPSGKTCLGWIGASQVHDVTTSGIYRIHRFDHKDASDITENKLALSVRLASGERIWAGLRRNFPNNPTLSSGAYLVWAHSGRNHRQIDCTPFSQIDGIPGSDFDSADFDRDDSALAQGNTWTSPDGSMEITNLGLGGTAPREYLDLRVRVNKSHADADPIQMFTNSSQTDLGLVGSYFNGNLSAGEGDWNTTHTRAGVRVDTTLSFGTADWGTQSDVGITAGTDADWDDFSVQWDGVLVLEESANEKSVSIYCDGGKFWIDRNNDGTFSADEKTILPFATTVEIPLPSTGSYPVRIHYREGSGWNVFRLKEIVRNQGDFELYQDASLTTDGLTASFVNASLRSVTSHADWRTSQTISGTRPEAMPLYWDNQMGKRADVGITGGEDKNWRDFSVQYDGWIRVVRRTRFLIYGDDGFRFWIDADANGSFAATAPEYNAASWGNDGPSRYSQFGEWIEPGNYMIRIQHEMGGGSNRFAFMGQPAAAFSEGYGAGIESGGHITAPASTSISGTFTVEAWVKPATTATMPIFSTRTPSADYGFTLKIQNGNEILGHIGSESDWIDSEANLSQTYRAGEWMHIAYAVSPSNYKIYLNGWLAKTVDLTGAPPAVLTDATHPVAIGTDPRFPAEAFVGQIDEVRIWDTTRTGEQIAQTMRSSVQSTTPGLASCWTLDGTLRDLKGNRNGSGQGAIGLISMLTPVDACSTMEEIPAALDQIVDGELATAGDSNWYCIHVKEAGTFEAWTTGDIDTIGTLYGSGSDLSLVEIDDEVYPARRNFRLIYDLTPGVYYLQVRGYEASTGPYTLHLNAHNEITPLEMDLTEGSLSWGSRMGGVFYAMESDHPSRWQFLRNDPWAGRGGPQYVELPSETLEMERRFFRVVNAPGKALFAARLRSSRSGSGSSIILGQTSGFSFVSGVPSNVGDTALLLDGAPLSQHLGVTIASSWKHSLRGVIQSPGDLSDTPGATFPAGTWLTTRTDNGSEVGGFTMGMVHFPFANGWTGGHIASDGSHLKTANVPDTFMTEVSEPGLVSLWATDGMINPIAGALFVIGAENAVIPNILSTVLSLAPDGSFIGWRVRSVKANANTDSPHAADWSFAYVPYKTEGIAIGRINSGGSIVSKGTELFTCVWDGVEIRTCVREGWSGVREDLLCL